jgi:hypothetical protein
MPLNDARIRAAKPDEKRYKLADGGGLYLVVEPNGSKLWRYKYRINGRENVFSIGAYPAVSILAARREHLAARERVISGEHPVKLKRATRAAQRFAAANTFKALAEEWYESKVTAKSWTDYYTGQVRAGYSSEVVEMQLAHVEANKTKRSYNHAKYLQERREMMRWFANELDASAAERAALALARTSAS